MTALTLTDGEGRESSPPHMNPFTWEHKASKDRAEEGGGRGEG